MRMLHLHSMFVQEVGRVADRGRHDSQAGVGEAALEGSAARSARLAAAGAEACVAGQARSAWDEGWECGEGLRGCRDRKRPGQASRKLQGAWVDSTPAPLKWKGRTWSNRGTGTSPCGREISTFDIRYARLMWFDIKFVRLSKYDTADVNSF